MKRHLITGESPPSYNSFFLFPDSFIELLASLCLLFKMKLPLCPLAPRHGYSMEVHLCILHELMHGAFVTNKEFEMIYGQILIMQNNTSPICLPYCRQRVPLGLFYFYRCSHLSLFIIEMQTTLGTLGQQLIKCWSLMPIHLVMTFCLYNCQSICPIIF